MEIKDLITIDPDIMGGQPVFKGTRVPIETLFDHLETGVDSVTKEQAVSILEIAK